MYNPNAKYNKGFPFHQRTHGPAKPVKELKARTVMAGGGGGGEGEFEEAEVRAPDDPAAPLARRGGSIDSLRARIAPTA